MVLQSTKGSQDKNQPKLVASESKNPWQYNSQRKQLIKIFPKQYHGSVQL